MWGEIGQEGVPIIVDDIDGNLSYTLYDWFSINHYWMEMVILDHNMLFRYLGTSTYMVDNKIQEILSEPGWMMGDINHDQSVDILDVLIIVNTIMYGEEYYFGYDINQDEIINVLDIILLLDIILYE